MRTVRLNDAVACAVRAHRDAICDDGAVRITPYEGRDELVITTPSAAVIVVQRRFSVLIASDTGESVSVATAPVIRSASGALTLAIPGNPQAVSGDAGEAIVSTGEGWISTDVDLLDVPETVRAVLHAIVTLSPPAILERAA